MANNYGDKCIEIIPSRLYFQCLDNISTLPSSNDAIRYMILFNFNLYILKKINMKLVLVWILN